MGCIRKGNQRKFRKNFSKDMSHRQFQRNFPRYGFIIVVNLLGIYSSIGLEGWKSFVVRVASFAFRYLGPRLRGSCQVHRQPGHCVAEEKDIRYAVSALERALAAGP